MSNQQFIRRLASDFDAGGGARMAPRLGAATVVASVLSLAAILIFLPHSPHFAHGPGRTVVFAIAAGSVLAVVAFLIALKLSCPENDAALRWLWLPVAVMAAGIGLEIAQTSSSGWPARFWGANPLACFLLVMVLSLPILTAVLFALRKGATTHPGQSGAMAGLLAGGIATALYTLHCPEDSLLFMGFWHGLAILTVTACGAAAGSRYLRW